MLHIDRLDSLYEEEEEETETAKEVGYVSKISSRGCADPFQETRKRDQGDASCREMVVRW